MKRFAIGMVLLTALACSPTHAQKLSEPKDVAFTAKCDGTTQRYVIMLPEGFDKNRPHSLLIALHGHGSDRWQYIRYDRHSPPAVREIAAKHRLILVAPDYRAKTSWMGPKAEADLVQIIEDLKRQYRIDKVFIAGGSMGGSSCLTFTALHPDLIDGVASFNGTANHLEYENFQEFIQKSYGGTKAEIPLEYKKRSAEYWPERFTMPVAITAGGLDKSVPPHSVMRLVNVLKKMNRKVLLIYRDQGPHSTTIDDAKAALEFIITGQTPATSPSKETAKQQRGNT
ncbi:MAG: alpha/beta fold hydrolase [Phycisphaerae bacterium]|nr:alpha/beta fold hydrolase [Phycisphaerae bacterium]